jgi:peroxiredoxin
MSLTLRRTFGAVCITCLLLPVVQGAGDELPRYRLKVGQELTYHLSSTSEVGSDDKAQSYGSDADWNVRVLRLNPDGSWRLLLHRTQSSWSGQDKTVRPGYASLGYCDLFPDGRNVVPALAGIGPDNGMDLDPASVFPRLPVDDAAAAKGWEGRHEPEETRTHYTREDKESRPGSTWVFTGVLETPFDKVYLRSSRTTYTYDLNRGLVAKGAGATFRGVAKSTTLLELRGIKENSAAAMTQLDAETDRYFAAAKVYNDLTDRAENAADAKELCAKAEAAIRGVRDRLTLSLLQDRVDVTLKGHEFWAKYYAEAAANRSVMLGKPSPDWQTTDFDGKTRSLMDYRSKVVVLDFWYRGCGWCIRAMPQVARLAEDFKSEPVAVLGMNIDSREEDARFVIEKMGLRYPILRARGLHEKYHMNGYPTMIVLDGKGVIRNVHFGYQPTLHDEVSETIRKLLAETKTAAK